MVRAVQPHLWSQSGILPPQLGHAGSAACLRPTGAGAEHRGHIPGFQRGWHHDLTAADATALWAGQPVHEEAQPIAAATRATDAPRRA